MAVHNKLCVYQDNKLYPVEAIGNILVFSKFIDPDRRKNNASFWRLNVGEKLPGKYRNIFDNANTLVLTNYHSKGLKGEAVKINTDTGVNFIIILPLFFKIILPHLSLINNGYFDYNFQ